MLSKCRNKSFFHYFCLFHFIILLQSVKWETLFRFSLTNYYSFLELYGVCFLVLPWIVIGITCRKAFNTISLEKQFEWFRFTQYSTCERKDSSLSQQHGYISVTSHTVLSLSNKTQTVTSFPLKFAFHSVLNEEMDL